FLLAAHAEHGQRHALDALGEAERRLAQLRRHLARRDAAAEHLHHRQADVLLPRRPQSTKKRSRGASAPPPPTFCRPEPQGAAWPAEARPPPILSGAAGTNRRLLLLARAAG